MKQQDLTYLLQHPEAVTPSQTESLAQNIKSYPYFQALHALYLKGLKQKESYKYNNALKITAAHTTDRSILFDYITSASFNQNEISEQIKQNSQNIKAIEVNGIDDISVHKSVEIDDALKAHIKATEGVLDPKLFEIKPVISNDIIEKEGISNESSFLKVDADNITPEEKLEIGKPLDFDKTESHSFMEWLKITSFKPIERKEQDANQADIPDKKEDEVAPLTSKLNIIDKFITENPKIKPITGLTPKPKLVDNRKDESDSLMTETLARIYLEQKNYDKAIQAYKILSLKYPEKSSFFAHQIKAVEELREQNKS
ncbi:hypothetical protein J4050_03995 [Winogradskyella sp. DF17]|uniref:Tetratricopeptide repeat protein n=1 Tax=Winogradskyella pelagia TaxID=2819984 RepID=A0ABS3SZI3_9FLAO|nr:tetratricopeptide repeat protein [Winogradskyella sp. DF17]MBO3115893.1 hypothetical protein [Winogradskyella sp. DF17]